MHTLDRRHIKIACLHETRLYEDDPHRCRTYSREHVNRWLGAYPQPKRAYSGVHNEWTAIYILYIEYTPLVSTAPSIPLLSILGRYCYTNR